MYLFEAIYLPPKCQIETNPFFPLSSPAILPLAGEDKQSWIWVLRRRCLVDAWGSIIRWVEWWKGRMVRSYPMCCGCFLAKKTIWGFGNRGLIFFLVAKKWCRVEISNIFNWVWGGLISLFSGHENQCGIVGWYLMAPCPANQHRTALFISFGSFGWFYALWPGMYGRWGSPRLLRWWWGGAFKLASDDMIYRKTTPSWQSLHPNFLGSPWCLPVLQGKFAWEWASRCLRGTLGGLNVFAEGPTACYMYFWCECARWKFQDIK